MSLEPDQVGSYLAMVRLLTFTLKRICVKYFKFVLKTIITYMEQTVNEKE